MPDQSETGFTRITLAVFSRLARSLACMTPSPPGLETPLAASISGKIDEYRS